jgi:hypothetical protein
LQHLVPARLAQRGRDELGADIAFGEGALVHRFVGSGWAGRRAALTGGMGSAAAWWPGAAWMAG